MQPQALWQEDPIFIEVGVKDADLALSLRREGYSKYLGVSSDARCVANLQAMHPELADHLTCSKREKIVRNNNADVLLLSGSKMLHLWKYRSVRHAESVAWRIGFHPLSLLALLGCLWHMISKRYSWPRVVAFRTPGRKITRIFVSRILRPKLCNRKSLHFIPHELGLTGSFRQFDQQNVRYVVLRWFESLPEIGPNEDVDLLVDDRSLSTMLEILQSQPGIQPCDVYSETGLSRSDYCGTPYYPAHVAKRLLDGRVRHKSLFQNRLGGIQRPEKLARPNGFGTCSKDLCMVPNPEDYFHSLAYHAVYHKGTRSNLDRGTTGLRPRGTPGHDFTGILTDMACGLQIEVDISLEGLHAYLQETGWGPSSEMLARLSVACPRNKWLHLLSQRLPSHLHDQGLAVFVLRQEIVERGFRDKIIGMIRESGFEIVAAKTLSPEEVDYAATRTRGGNWKVGPFDVSGGPPAVAIIAYDANPLAPNRRQRRKFPQRTNARIFAKEIIRDAVISELPPKQGCNALHSSDNAAEAWHLIEVFAPELIEQVRERLDASIDAQPAFSEIRQAA